MIRQDEETREHEKTATATVTVTADRKLGDPALIQGAKETSQ